MSDSQENSKPQMVTLTIDGKEISVPQGTNLIEAAKEAGVEIPHYCYHPHLSVAGNCRMCQVQVEGQRKLDIACNCTAQEGMAVQTQESNQEVADAQRATLEFLLINHPLDCTVCDQAGHCKLQDYYYEYNAKPSRFIEDKVKKVKAEPLGPEIIYDGERCILCTRCVRFCDEISGSSELGVLNRGDKSVIAIHSDRELDNPLSGSVVDLCPVGALTHRRWRFNTRIWYSKEVDSICSGCSTGCNAKVYTRDDQVVQVKARLNAEVNEEWMCDKGRYGFGDFQPEVRSANCLVKGSAVGFEEAVEAMKGVSTDKLAVFLSPFLTLEDFWCYKEFVTQALGAEISIVRSAVQLKTRTLTEEEAILVSPDQSPNVRSSELVGLFEPTDDWRGAREKDYQSLLAGVRAGEFENILVLGQRAVLEEDYDQAFRDALTKAKFSALVTPDASFSKLAGVYIPSITANETEGLYFNRHGRLQRVRRLLDVPDGSFAVWQVLKLLAEKKSKAILSDSVTNERSLYRFIAKEFSLLNGLSLMDIGTAGLSLEQLSHRISERAEA